MISSPAGKSAVNAAAIASSAEKWSPGAFIVPGRPARGDRALRSIAAVLEQGETPMKTPWKYLVDLTSRRRAAKGSESSIRRDIDPAALDHQAEQALVPPSTENSASADYNKAVPAERVASASDESEDNRGTVQAALPVDGGQALTPSPSEARRSSADGAVETNSKSLTRSRPSRQRRKGAPANIVVARAGVVTRAGQSAPRSSARDAFFDDVASLDEDIKKLRSELARKLQLQNAQLKTMLKRFDVS
ncbi:hypothetical protein [Rhizobium sp. CNPSo 3490]|uniref:hypothetical protein n=1 Tax=Rhizobium sp. CNPSo 3490 TaxID=3021407 RepID=UPI00254DDB9B|nr:hypothetical protein [Rhizobium sp. CNPSo 3490]MDK4731507.1 hypothetical protein [Rhizobium sp. CNPSo 3490]